MPETIANMRHEIANLKQLTSPDILGSLLDIKTQISLLINEQKSLQTINADLMTRVNILTKEKDDLQERLLIAQSQSPQQKKSTNINSKTLLIGNSLLRNIESTNSDRLKVSCHSGATFDSLTYELSQNSEQFGRIIIVSGTTDASKDTTTEQIDINARGLLAEAKKHTMDITFSSVLPKVKPNDQQLKIDHMNENLKKMCKEAPGCSYSDHDGSFRLANLTTNDAMFVSDGYHLNWKGSQILIDNLDLKNIAAVRRPPRRTPHKSWYPHEDMSRSPNTDWNYSTDWQYGNDYASCIWCSGTDHTASECPRRRSRSCFQCRSTDHLMRDCPWRR